MRYFFFLCWSQRKILLLELTIFCLTSCRIEAPLTALAITSVGSPARVLSCLPGAVTKAVDISSVTMATQHHLTVAANTIVNSSSRFHGVVMPRKQWIDQKLKAILALRSVQYGSLSGAGFV